MDQKEITKKLIDFRDEREWGKFHTVNSLANSAHLEAGELANLFQWGKTPGINLVAEEIADTAIYLLYLCDKYGFDLEDIILQKIGKNDLKYPLNIDHENALGWKE